MFQTRSLVSLKAHTDLQGATAGKVTDAMDTIAYNHSERNYKMGQRHWLQCPGEPIHLHLITPTVHSWRTGDILNCSVVLGSAMHQQGNNCSMEVGYSQRLRRVFSVCGFMKTACTVSCCASCCTLSADARGSSWSTVWLLPCQTQGD